MPDLPMDASEIAMLIDMPLERWPGNCHAVAELMLRKTPVHGMRLVRGHYHGYIHPRSVYSRGPQQHSWFELEDGRILDPTRWAMTRPDRPSIFLGSDEELDYDEGGLIMRAKGRMPALCLDFLSGSTQNRPVDVVLKKLEKLDILVVQDLFVAGGLAAPYGAPGLVDASRLYDRFYDPVEHFLTPEPFFRTLKDIGLAALVPVDTMRRVLEPELVNVNPGANMLYDVPKAPELSAQQQLFKVFCKFLSVEFRDMAIEDELEELGHSLDDLHSMLNNYEYALRLDPEDPYLSGSDASGLAVIAGELLGKGYGTELQVERYAKSIGMSRQDLHHELAAFGERSGYDLPWLLTSDDDVNDECGEFAPAL